MPPGAAQLSSSVVTQLEGACAEGGAPLSALQTHFIQNMIHDTMEEFRYWSYWSYWLHAFWNPPIATA